MIKGSAKIRITVDVDDWEIGSWGKDLADAIDIKVERCHDYFELSFTPQIINFDAIVKKIAKEAIEEFFNSYYVVSLTPEGISIGGEGSGLSSDIVIPWGDVMFTGDPRPAIKQFIAKAEETNEFDE